MEDRRCKNSSGDKFSYPSMGQDSDFEFGSVTTPAASPSSPADHLFFNGRLLPHSFPIQPTNSTNSSYSRSTSRTSSVGSSKDSSSMSSWSNSRSSSCSTSARTSTSEANSDQRRPLKVVAIKTPVHRKNSEKGQQAHVLVRQYGSSKRWQFIAPAPELSHQASRRRKAEIVVKEDGDQTGAGCCRRFFRSVLSACKECHAIKPSMRHVELQ